jgi:type IV pilus assembly protein PilE
MIAYHANVQTALSTNRDEFMKNSNERGFTLIEVMVVMVIVAIIAAIAIPQYKDYVIRSRITHAIQGLATKQTQMEQCYQDNHTYDPSTACPACVADNSNENFNFSCPTLTGTTFTIQATGKGPMTGFVYTITEHSVKGSAISGAPSGWNGNSSTCWITKKGGSC